MQSSLARITLGALLAVLAFVAMAAFFLYRATQQQVLQAGQRTPAYAGKLLAQEIVTVASAWGQATQAIAQSPMTLRLLQTQDETERRQRLAEIVSLHPHLGQIQIIGSDQVLGRQTIPAQLSARQLRMIESASAAQQPQANLHAEAPLLTLIEPVRSPGAAIVGYVLVTRHFQDIGLLFNQSPLIDGYAELQQANGQTDILLKRGNEQLKARGTPETLTLDGTPWRLVIWTRAESGALANDPLRVLYGMGVVLAVLIVLPFGVAYYLGNRALQRDLSALAKLFSDITHDRMRKQYDVRLKEVKNAYQVMYQLGKLMVGKHLRMVNSAETDHLSQVSNRRSFEAKQREVFARVHEGWAHSLLILDIDNFKQVNDTYGHEAGDQLIVQFGQALKKNLRGSDFVARLGGDEFCVIFPNTALAKASELAQRLREKFPTQMELLPNVMHNVGWSGGLSEYSRRDQSENAALARADQALLDAKRSGRDRTEIKAAA
jgi:diguanylate cyclase (GGDEF)-like protein